MKKHLEIEYENKVLRGYINHVNYNKCIIIVHGIGGNKLGHKYIFRQLSDVASKYDVSTIRMDFIGHGESDGEFYETRHSKQIEQLKKIIDYSKNVLKYKEVYVVGTSIGSYIVTQAVKEDVRIKKIVLWNPQFNISRFKQNIIIDQNGIVDMQGLYVTKEYYDDLDLLEEDYNLVVRDVLVIQGCKDIDADYSDAKNICKFNKWNYVELLGANHLFESTVARKELYKKTIKFILGE